MTTARRVPRLLVAALTFLVTVVLTPPASAGVSRLLLVDPDPELDSAVRAALSAWSTVVLVERIVGPGSAMPGSAERARLLAKRRAADAVVWVSQSEDGFALWMYDGTRDRVLARRLSTPPPFDEATAASVALSIKTLLRHSQVPPESERVQETPTTYWLSLAVSGGIRPNATSARTPEARFGLGATAWAPFSSGPVRLGAGLEVTSGPGIAVRERAFTGRFTETAAFLGLHGRLRLAPDFDLTFVPSAGFDVTTIDGVARGLAGEAQSVRVNGLLAAHLEVGYRFAGPVRAALRPGVVRPLRRQTYLVHGDPVLRASPLMLSAMIVLEVSVF